MGWFWADALPKPVVSIAPHPIPQQDSSTPSACPVRGTSQAPAFPRSQTSPTSAPSSCPVKSPSQPARYPTTTPAPSAATSPEPAPSSSFLSKLNPLNMMPRLENQRLSESQSVELSLEREPSTIPRGDTDANWEYPSPQQMYNAMLRKGYADTTGEDVPSMVAIHNFLNEGAWAEIVDWENIFAQGLSKGWERCQEGEEGLAKLKMKREFAKARREALGIKTPKAADEVEAQPKLLRFQGRPQEPTPKARFFSGLSYLLPGSFSSEPPFDRHDWYVARQQADGTTKEVRYVIDYYGGGLQATGEPVFYLDIRPALDTPTAACERLMRWGGEVWYKASGGAVRREKAHAENK